MTPSLQTFEKKLLSGNGYMVKEEILYISEIKVVEKNGNFEYKLRLY